MKRKVEIMGDKYLLENFSKIFNENDLSIVKDGKRFILESEFLNVLSDEDIFEGRVIELLNLLNTYALLFSKPEGKFTYQISEVHENGTEIIPIKSSVVGHGKAYVNISGGTIVPNKKTELTNQIGRNLVKIVENDEKIKEVFIYINSNFNSWYELYKIYEVIQTDTLAQKIMKSEKYKKKMSNGKFKKGDEIFSINAHYHRHSSKGNYKGKKRK